MRLLHTRTGLFHWEEDPENVKYAILSHVWARGGEQSYQDLLKIQDEVRVQRAKGSSLSNDAVLTRLSSKIRHTCERARADGLELVWIDSEAGAGTGGRKWVGAPESIELNSAVFGACLAAHDAGQRGSQRQDGGVTYGRGAQLEPNKGQTNGGLQRSW